MAHTRRRPQHSTVTVYGVTLLRYRLAAATKTTTQASENSPGWVLTGTLRVRWLTWHWCSHTSTNTLGAHTCQRRSTFLALNVAMCNRAKPLRQPADIVDLQPGGNTEVHQRQPWPHPAVALSLFLLVTATVHLVANVAFSSVCFCVWPLLL